MTSQPSSLRQFTDAAAGAVARTIAGIQKDAQRERELRDAEHRARLAELDTRILAVANLERQVTSRLTTLKDGEPGEPGTSLTLEDITPIVEEAVARAFAAIPAPKDGEPGQPGDPGKDVEPDFVRLIVAEEVANAVAALPIAKDGHSVTVEDCRPVIDEALIAAVAALPPPQNGKSVTVEECLPVITEAVQRAVTALPPPKDGAPGKLPTVKAWTDSVHYEGNVVAHEGSTFQALRDTAKAPPHEDWICIAEGGKHGRSPVPKGLYDETAEYAELDVVMLNGGSFIARADNPGPCPGNGWFLFASQGKQGKPGPASKGDRGPPGPSVTAISVDDDGMLTLRNADGSTATCDMYPLLSRIAK